jgi:Copper amine oxidase N-terminal domain.
MKTPFKILMTTLILVGLMISPASAAEQKTVDLGDPAYQIIVPGYIGQKDITEGGQTIHAIVVEKPAQNSNGRYDFYEIVTTDPKAVTITSNPSYMGEAVGDLMSDVENGRLSYTPTLYDDLANISDQPLYLGFSARDKDFKTIKEFPVWFVFGDAGTSVSTPTTTPTTTPVTTPAKEVAAKLTSSKVVVDGKQVAFEAYSIDGYNYFKLRDLAMAITGSSKQFEVAWDGDKKAINLVSGEAYTPVGKELTPGSGTASVKGIANQSKIYVNGEEQALEAYTINGNNYFKLRDVADAFDFGVAWNGTLNQIAIDTTAGYTAE